MENITNYSANSLLNFKQNSNSNMEDIILEISEVLQMDYESAKILTTDVLNYYHFGNTKYPQYLERVLFHLIVHITQPYRIPVMTSRMDSVLNELKLISGLKSVLDYGGGGGKDSIIYSKLGYEVTYADLLSDLTPMVKKRFEIRNLDIAIEDVTLLHPKRFDIINCMDVIEHVYDVEFVVADIVARLTTNGHLICYPCFVNSWDGDHIEKNCGYITYFPKMLSKIGLVSYKNPMAVNSKSAKKITEYVLDFGRWLYFGKLEIYHLVKIQESNMDIEDEREMYRKKLYQLSKKYSMLRVIYSLIIAPVVLLFSLFLVFTKKSRKIRTYILSMVFSNIIDNLAIWRLSKHRLKELKKTKMNLK